MKGLFSLGMSLFSALCLAHETPTDFTEMPNANELVGGHSSLSEESRLGADLGLYAAASSLKSRALSILAWAEYRTSSDFYRRVYPWLHNSLNNASIHAPPAGQDFNACVAQPSTLAFVMRSSPSDIYLCASLWNNYSSTGDYMAQVLIHESAHTVGETNECTATNYEISAMRVSGVGLAMRNGYMSRCGLD